MPSDQVTGVISSAQSEGKTVYSVGIDLATIATGMRGRCVWRGLNDTSFAYKLC